MNDKERKASKYLPFDALKGLKEAINLEYSENQKREFPLLSEDQLLNIDEIIFECYSLNKPINISYFEDGDFNEYSGVIERIDYINRQIVLIPKRRFSINRIIDVDVDLNNELETIIY